MPDYQINVVISFAESSDDDARDLAENTARVLRQFWPAREVAVAVFGKPLDVFSRRVV